MAATQNSDLLYAALRKAGVQLAPGRGPGPAQIKDAIGEQNRMIGGWNLSPLTILGERVDLYDTIPNQQSYTMGLDPSGRLKADWQAERPAKIVRANLLLPTAATSIEKIRRPLAIWDVRQWANIRYQAVYTYPEGLYLEINDPQKTPFSRIYFRPIPDADYQVELFCWQRIPRFQSAADFVELPDGWEDAIVNNLAVRLASFPWVVQRAMDPQVREDARRSLDLLRQYNAAAPMGQTDPELSEGQGYYNYLSGLVE